MRVTTTWKGHQQYDALSESGHHVMMDADDAHVEGPSPMEMLLMGLCACTSVDVVSILSKKRQPFTSLEVTAQAERAAKPPRVFTSIRLNYRVSGNVSKKAMHDAIALSKNKYCSVSTMLEKSVPIEFAIEYLDEPRGAAS